MQRWSHLVGGLECHKKPDSCDVAYSTLPSHLLVAILSSQPGNEPVSHIWHRIREGNADFLLPQTVWDVHILFEDPLDLSGPLHIRRFSLELIQGDILLTPDAPRVIWSPWLMRYVRPEVPEGNTQRSDLWFEAACVERDPSRSIILWPKTGRAYWAPVTTLTSCSLLTSALSPAALWTKCSLIVTKSKVTGLIREVSCKEYTTFLRGHVLSVKESKWGYFYRYFWLLLWYNP